MASWRFEAIGVPWEVATPDDLPDSLTVAITDRIAHFDATYSRFREDSLVTRISREAGSYEFPSDIAALFDLYLQLYQATAGAITPLVGKALEHWGYDANYRLSPAAGNPPRVPPLTDMLSLEGSILHAVRPVGIDIGAAGKGFLVDEVVGLMQASGLTEGIVDASGDLRHLGGKAERVGLEHPGDPRQVVGVVELHGQSLAASSPNRRSWAPGVHHILDAVTGFPTVGTRATWAITDDCAVADGLATALCVVEPSRLEEYFSFHWVVMDDRGQLRTSAHFPGEVFA